MVGRVCRATVVVCMCSRLGSRDPFVMSPMVGLVCRAAVVVCICFRLDSSSASRGPFVMSQVLVAGSWLLTPLVNGVALISVLEK